MTSLAMPGLPSARCVQSQRKSAITYQNFAVLSRVPETSASAEFNIKSAEHAIQLDEHLFPYEGCRMDPARFIWGVYGSVSQVRALSMAEAEATKTKSKNLVMQGVYQLDDAKFTRGQINRATMRQTGYLHTDRLQAEFRDELKAELLSRATDRYPGFELGINRVKPLKEIMLDYAGLVQDLFDLDDKVTMVVHPVRPSWNPDFAGSIYIATMRRIRARISPVEVKHLPRIRVNQ